MDFYVQLIFEWIQKIEEQISDQIVNHQSILEPIKSVSIGSNMLKKLPQNFGNFFTNILYIFIIKIKFNYKTKTEKFPNLTWLSVCDNLITEVPKIISTLTNLEVLDLRINKISILPNEICQLTNLTTLLLSSNCLQVS